MKIVAQYVGRADPENNGGKLHKIRLMVAGSPFISSHSYASKANAVNAARRLNEKLKLGGK